MRRTLAALCAVVAACVIGYAAAEHWYPGIGLWDPGGAGSPADPGIGDAPDDPGIGTGPGDTEIADAQDSPGIGSPETVLAGLRIPWSVGWLPDGTMLYTERGGKLWSWDGGGRVMLLELGVAGGEGGLLGLAVDPGFEENGFVYLYYTHGSPPQNRVERYVVADGGASPDRVLVDGIPGHARHDGGRIQFGPDGLLYIATGDAVVPELAQDPGSLAGKMLRVDRDGGVPEGNPFPGSPVYSMGHRNPQGMDWDADGNLVITEHGPSGFEGSGRDEINLVVPGGNYGWPRVTGGQEGEGFTAPLYHTGGDTWAPSGAEFYYGDKIPQWHGKYIVAGLRGQSLYVVDIDLDSGTAGYERWYQGEFGRLRDVQTGPDGRLYVLANDRILAIPGG